MNVCIHSFNSKKKNNLQSIIITLLPLIFTVFVVGKLVELVCVVVDGVVSELARVVD